MSTPPMRNSAAPHDTIHAAFATAPGEIVSVVAQISSSSVAGQHKIARGYDNEVHQVSLFDGTDLYLHIRRHGEPMFADITWALGQARAAGAPVPEVLLCDRAWLDGAEREVMIQRAIPGKPLQELVASLSAEQLRQCYLQALPALAAIHQVAVPGFQMRRAGVWDFISWDDMAAAWLAEHRRSQDTLIAAGLSENEIVRVIAALEQLLQRFPCHRPVLLHGDFTPGHLLFDDALRFTGLVDFGQFHGGSPVFDIDIAIPDTYYHRNTWRDRFQREWLRESYGDAPFWDDLGAHQLVYRLHNELGVLNNFVVIGEHELVAVVVPVLRTLLAEAEAYLRS